MAGHMKFPRGPHAARGPRVGQHWSRGSGLGLLKSTFHAENFICQLFWSISSHFGTIHSWNACHSLFTKTCYFGVKGHSRSSMLTFLRRSSPVLVVISSMSVPICNHFHFSQAISCEAFFSDYLHHIGQQFGCLNIYNFVVVISTGDWGESLNSSIGYG